MAEGVRHKHRIRTRVRNRRSIRVLLLCLGFVGLMISAGLATAYWFSDNPKLRILSLLYAGVSLVVLLLRQTLVLIVRLQHGEKDVDRTVHLISREWPTRPAGERDDAAHDAGNKA